MSKGNSPPRSPPIEIRRKTETPNNSTYFFDQKKELRYDENNGCINRYCEKCLNSSGKMNRISFEIYKKLIFLKYPTALIPDNNDISHLELMYPVEYDCRSH